MASAALQPGLQIRPVLTHEDVVEMVHRLYGLRDVQITDLNAYDDRNYHIRVKEYQASLWPHGYVFKVVNTLDSQKPSHIEVQTELLMYLDSHGFTCPQPVKNVDGKYLSVEELPKRGPAPRRSHVVRLLTFRPGRILADVPVSPGLMFQLGGFVARLDRCLQGFHHPVLERHETLWRLNSAPQARQFAFAVEDEKNRQLVEQVLDEFERNVLPNYGAMEKGTVHGDLNEQNLVCTEEEGVSVVLDLGDCHVSSYLFELAVCLCYIMLLRAPPPLGPVDVAGHVLAGYCAVRPLPDAEMRMLKAPDNAYLLTTARRGWGLLRDLWGAPPGELEARWKDILASCRGGAV
ncbi:hydroxylysine kinase isoform X2 [Bacillus rossius redtenbacheri]|uniref:hydroxylysine kinase isoform X2 n=1 Tax=Bacillus rossius redtenbacheri TaxID=93214 RepID=UPI002FDE7DEA